MSSESSELDNVSSTEDIDSTEFFTASDSSPDSGSSSYFTTFDRRSIKTSGTEEDGVNDVAAPSLNTSNEKQHEFDIVRTYLSSLKGIPPKDLNRTRKSSANRKARARTWTGKTSSLERPSVRNRPSLDCLENPSSRMVSSLDPLNEPTTGRVSSVDSSKRPSSRMVSFLDALNEPSYRRVSSVDSPSSRIVSSLDPLNEPSARSISSVNSSKRPSSRMISSLDPLKEPTTRRVSSVNSSKRPSSRMVSAPDPLNAPSFISLSSVDPLRAPSSTKVSSVNPLEGPSTKTVRFTDSLADSLSRTCNLHHSEEANEVSDFVPTTDPNASFSRTLRAFSIRYSSLIRRSNCYLLFNVALLLLPFSAGYMASKYLELCDGCQYLPLMMLALGYLGVILITLRIASILSKHHFNPPLPGSEFNAWMMLIFIPFFLLLLHEIGITYACYPVFTPSKSNKKFCLKPFYDYAYYLNMIVPSVIVLLTLIHLPGWFEPEDDYE